MEATVAAVAAKVAVNPKEDWPLQVKQQKKKWLRKAAKPRMGAAVTAAVAIAVDADVNSSDFIERLDQLIQAFFISTAP